jgi:DNA-binding response OmpR family regulator
LSKTRRQSLQLSAIRDLLEELGYLVAGPTDCLATALEMAEQEQFSAAIVDINIRGTKAYSVLRVLNRRAIPYLVASGQDDWSMPSEFSAHPRLSKPFSERMLEEKLASILGRPRRDIIIRAPNVGHCVRPGARSFKEACAPSELHVVARRSRSLL